MIEMNSNVCPECNGNLKYYDKVSRTIRIEYGKKCEIDIRRFKCKKCGKIHREIPYYVIPYKHYTAQIIEGVLKGSITSDMLIYEDYPSEMTMKRWISRYAKNTVSFMK